LIFRFKFFSALPKKNFFFYRRSSNDKENIIIKTILANFFLIC
jgi:hypothetical protein